MISEAVIARILERADIVDVIAPHVELKKAGANYSGLCPFHGEKTPSFTVSQTKQFFHCFGCGVSGDAIKFLQEHLGSSFRDAVQDLAQTYGIAIEEDETPEQKLNRQVLVAQQKRVLGVNDRAQQYFRKWLVGQDLESGKARAYIAKRAVSPEMQERFGLGYSPSSSALLALCGPRESEKFKSSVKALIDSGLVIEDTTNPSVVVYRDRFRDRLMFPIHDTRGALIGYGARALRDDQEPKYLNSPETPVFEKKRILYGMHLAAKSIQKEKSAWVVEGYMDVIALHQAGITNSVAALGTAFGEDHAKALARAADVIYFVFDGDAAGKKAAWRAVSVMLPHLKPSLRCHFVTIEGGKDVDEFLRTGTAEQLRKQATGAPTLGQYVFDCLDQQVPAHTPEGKALYESRTKEIIALVPPDNPLRRIMYEMLDQKLGRAKTRPSAGRTPFRSGGSFGSTGLTPGMADLKDESERVKRLLNPGMRVPYRPPAPLALGQAGMHHMLQTPTIMDEEKSITEAVAQAIRLAPRWAANIAPSIRQAADSLGVEAALEIHRALDVIEVDGIASDAPVDVDGSIDVLDRFPDIARSCVIRKQWAEPTGVPTP